MTKQHFIALANHIRKDNEYGFKWTAEKVESLADFLQTQNPNFKRDRWLAYINGECGKNGGKVKQAASTR